jgi:putative FmdB family regulatory protein
MPIYEYRCRHCGDVREVMQKVTDRPLRKCGKCSGRLEKLVSRTSFQLKGGGWFATGYGRDAAASKKPKTADKPAAETADSPKPGTKRETKTAAAAG